MQEVSEEFQLLIEKNDCEILIDRISGIIKIEFIGVVDLATAKFIIKTTLEVMKNDHFHKLVLNRTLVHHFTEAANGWLKGFLLENRHKFNIKISRVAIVSLDSDNVGMYAHFMKTAFQVIFPGVKLASFEFEDSAIDWMS